MSGPGTTEEKRTIGVKIGGKMITGIPAVVVLLAFVALALALVFLLRPTFAPSPLWISAALWLMFIVYWSYAALRAAPAKKSESRASRQLHANLLNLALVLLFLHVPGLRARWLPATSFVVQAGIGLHAGSVLLAVWARRHLGRNWSVEISEKVGHELVRSGPYRVVRHPIYTAMLGMYVGTALVSGELHALVAVAIVLGAYWRKIRLEEENLRLIFGNAFDEYRGKSWALIPGVY